jgi:hypothetical protein
LTQVLLYGLGLISDQYHGLTIVDHDGVIDGRRHGLQRSGFSLRGLNSSNGRCLLSTFWDANGILQSGLFFKDLLFLFFGDGYLFYYFRGVRSFDTSFVNLFGKHILVFKVWLSLSNRRLWCPIAGSTAVTHGYASTLIVNGGRL